MQTTPPMERATTLSAADVIPRDRKMRHVSASVATVMPEIGFDEEPISPVKRDDTVTNKKPKTRTSAAPRIDLVTASLVFAASSSRMRNKVNKPSNANEPNKTVRMDRSSSLRLLLMSVPV